MQNSMLTCNCSHLTEFAILRQRRLQVESAPAWEFLPFAAAYAVLSAVCAVQIGLLRYYNTDKVSKLAQQETAMYLLLAVCRTVQVGAYTAWGMFAMQDGMLIVLATANIMSIWAFLVLIFNWVEIILTASKGKRKTILFPWARNLLLTLSGLVSVAVVVLFCVASATGHEMSAVAGGMISSAMMLVLGFIACWCSYKMKIIFSAGYASKANKLLVIASSGGLCFLLQAIVNLVLSEMTGQEFVAHGTGLVCFSFFLDIVVACCVTWLFSHLMPKPGKAPTLRSQTVQSHTLSTKFHSEVTNKKVLPRGTSEFTGAALTSGRTLEIEELTHLTLSCVPLSVVDDLSCMLASNTSLEDLTLVKCRMETKNIHEFAQALRENEGINTLDLSGNGIAAEGGVELAQVLASNKNLSSVCLFNNQLGR